MINCKLHLGDCAEIMKTFESNSIDLTVTSPPYDALRSYRGFVFDFSTIAQELYRVTKIGGVVVWIVGDQTIDGSETGTSFRQALYFREIGFRLHDTMIWHKKTPPKTHNRYEQHFDFMFVLSKNKPKTFNPIRTKSKNAGKKRSGSMRQDGDCLTYRNAKGNVNDFKIVGNLWNISCSTGGTRDRIAYRHPAIFPEKLAEDHILSWSNADDTVFDPFMGSGTTGKMALLNNRKFIGIDIAPAYLEIARTRIESVNNSMP